MYEALRKILPLYLLVFFLVAFLGRSYMVWRRTGINPYVVGRTNRPIDFVEGFYAVPVVLLLTATLAFSFFPSVYAFATPITWLDSQIVQAIGLVLMMLALIWVAIAQTHMGKSWRRSAQELRAKTAEMGIKYVLARHDFLFAFDKSTLVDDKKSRVENDAKLKIAKDFILDPANTVRADSKFSLVKVF